MTNGNDVVENSDKENRSSVAECNDTVVEEFNAIVMGSKVSIVLLIQINICDNLVVEVCVWT